MGDLKSDAIKLLNNLSNGYMKGMAYDTAWAARIPKSSATERPLFPEALLWLVTAQHDDGSWGGELEYYYYDKIISTLSAIITLSKTHRADKFSDLITAGEEYIWYNIKKLTQDKYETVGFELIFPTLMAEARKLDLNLPYRENFYATMKEKKIKLAIGDLIHAKASTITHSLEFLGDDVNVKHIISAQEKNGSCGNSPAATAYLLTNLVGHGEFQEIFNNSLEYLKTVLGYNSGSAMTLYPFEIFEYSWIINNLMISKMPLKDSYMPLIDFMKKHWVKSKKGMSLSVTYPTMDLDDTAMVFRILKSVNIDVDPEIFENFESDNHFNTYTSERSPSPIVNIRVLEAIKDCPEYEHHDDYIDKVLKFLRKERIQGAYWVDKWNISPYYCTSHAIPAICGIDEKLTNKAINWLQKTQNYDGSWGTNGGTQEETANTLLALLFYHNNIEKIDLEPLSNGAEFLKDNYNDINYPETWIGKGLYTPTNIIRSAVISAIYYYQKTIKN
jgi:hypothetical protein